jgi:chromosome partitioning protein
MRPMIILIGGEKGGTGKTTVATNLSASLATAGRDVLLLDADRQGSAQWWCDRRQEAGIAPAIQCVQRYGHLASIVRDMASRFDDVVIDCGGQDSTELRSAMLVAEAMFIPIQASIFDLVTLQHVAQLVETAQINNPQLRAHVFVSRAPTNQSSEEKAALKALEQALPSNIPVLQTVVHDRRAFRDAAKSGKAVLEWTDAKATSEFEAFCSEIIKLATATTEAA